VRACVRACVRECVCVCVCVSAANICGMLSKLGLRHVIAAAGVTGWDAANDVAGRLQ
jgi:hypothetical protein